MSWNSHAVTVDASGEFDESRFHVRVAAHLPRNDCRSYTAASNAGTRGANHEFRPSGIRGAFRSCDEPDAASTVEVLDAVADGSRSTMSEMQHNMRRTPALFLAT